MTNYRRNRVPGATYAFTVNLEQRGSTLLVDRIVTLRTAIRHVRTRRPFHIDAWAVLPDHMHVMLTLPDGDTDYSTRLRLIKTYFSKAIELGEDVSDSRLNKNERGIWQRRFWEHTIRGDADYVAHMDYIHFNAVHHGLVDAPAAWAYSTFLDCARRGLYPLGWTLCGGKVVAFGERLGLDDGLRKG